MMIFTGTFQRANSQKFTLPALLIGLTLILLATQPAQANVIGFDFGSTFFKITLVKPGQPFSIVENIATKRKTETWVTITQEERYFGVDSLTESTKYPVTSFSQLHRLVGQPFESSFVEDLKNRRFLVNEFAEDDRGLVGWKITRKHENGTEEAVIMYTEELVAQLLKYGRQMSERQSGGTIKDCVITIPSYYTPQQRRMILDSADIAGLSVLQLIHENTAAATMFGIDRLDTEKPLVVLFYNMGGMDTEVSVVRYSAITEKVSNKSYEHIEILSEASDSQLGGQDFDLTLLNMLADRFNALKEREGKPDIRLNQKAIKRLQKEVIKIKDILSANKQNQIKIGELADYVTLLTTIDRKEFEEAAQPLFDRVIAPVELALKRANLTIAEIDQIELLGGGIRVPKIQELLVQTLQKSDLGVHLNGDEAMCFGSAFIASNSSASFKVRKVYLTVHPQVQYSIHITPLDETKLVGAAKQGADDNNDESEDLSDGSQSTTDEAVENQTAKVAMVYEKNYVLYKKSDYLGQKKSLSLTYDADMKIDVYSEHHDETTGDLKREKVATFTVNGIDTVAANDVAKQNTTSQPKVALSFELTRSGFIQLNKAEVKLEETYVVEERVPTPKKNKTLRTQKESTVNNDTSSDNSTESQNTTTEETPTPTEEPAPTAPQFIKKTKKRTIPYPLNNIEKQYFGVNQMTNEQLKGCRERMRWLEKRDEDKLKTDKAKNDFESVIYALRDWISEEDNVPFVGASKVEDVESLFRQAENWLEDEGYNAKYGEYISRFQELNGQFQSFKSRKEEYGLRESAIENAKTKLAKLQDKTEELEKKKAWITAEQRKDVLDRITETLTWLEEVIEKQKGVALDEDPAFKVSEIDMRLKRVSNTFDRVSNTPKPKPPDSGKNKKKKMPKNIKIDNMTFDGNSDIDWNDFITINNGGGSDEAEEEEPTQQQQQQQEDNTKQEEETKKPYDASEEDL